MTPHTSDPLARERRYELLRALNATVDALRLIGGGVESDEVRSAELWDGIMDLSPEVDWRATESLRSDEGFEVGYKLACGRTLWLDEDGRWRTTSKARRAEVDNG